MHGWRPDDPHTSCLKRRSKKISWRVVSQSGQRSLSLCIAHVMEESPTDESLVRVLQACHRAASEGEGAGEGVEEETGRMEAMRLVVECRVVCSAVSRVCGACAVSSVPPCSCSRGRVGGRFVSSLGVRRLSHASQRRRKLGSARVGSARRRADASSAWRTWWRGVGAWALPRRLLTCCHEEDHCAHHATTHTHEHTHGEEAQTQCVWSEVGGPCVGRAGHWSPLQQRCLVWS